MSGGKNRRNDMMNDDGLHSSSSVRQESRRAGEQEHAGWLVAGAWKDSPEPGKKGGRSEPAIPSQT